MIPLLAVTVDQVVTVAARIAGTAALAGLLAGTVALCYRWYVREAVPRGLALLVGLAGVAVVVNTTPLLAQEIADTAGDIEVLTALFNITVFVVGGLGAAAGARLGDGLGTDLFGTAGRDLDADVSEIVQSVGRVITVELPEEIDDIVGYDPVPEATKEALAGRRFLFPRRLSRSELRERLISRLKSDYGVGHVDLELAEDGSVEHLGVGSRAAGIGPTLPPATNAVAIRADPAHAASPGDLVQVWETDPARRVLTGELRGVAGDVVTVAIDGADTPKLDPTSEYKLVTLPVQDRPDREFAALLRAADETMAAVTVEAGSTLDGKRVGELAITVAAITREDERAAPLPTADRALSPGDVVYAIATPDVLRQLTAAAESAGRASGADGTGRDRSRDDPPEQQEAAEPAGAPENIAETDPASRETGAAAAAADTDSAADQTAPGASEQPQADDGAESASADENDVDQTTADDSGAEPATAADASQDDASEATEEHQPEAADGDDSSGLGGSAFPDTDDLPGIDPEEAAPTLPDERNELSDESGASAHEDGESAAAEADDEGKAGSTEVSTETEAADVNTDEGTGGAGGDGVREDRESDDGDAPETAADTDGETDVPAPDDDPLATASDVADEASADQSAPGARDASDLFGDDADGDRSEADAIDDAWEDVEPLGTGDDPADPDGEELRDIDDLLGDDAGEATEADGPADDGEGAAEEDEGDDRPA